MTEYDYSPEAYERYLDTQHRISRWVDNTEAHSHEFRAPFGPRSDVDPSDLDDRSEAGASIPRGGSASGYYSARRGYGEPGRDFPLTSPGHGPAGMPAAPPMQHPPFYTPMPVHAKGPFVPSAAPPMGAAYPPPPQMMSPPVSPQQRIVIQTYPKHHSSHHHSHHSKRPDSRSHKSKSKTRTYIIQPPPSVSMQSYPYPVGTAAPYSGYPYADSSAVTSPTSYPSGYYSPPSSGSQILSPPGAPSTVNPSYYPQPAAAVPSSYVIIPPKGRNVRVIYA